MTDTASLTDLTATVDAYLGAWTEPDAARRRGLVERAWADDGELIDPPLAAAGHEAISDMAATMQSQFPGHTFHRVSAVDEHHGHFRFAWTLVAPDGSVTLVGTDVGEVSADGTLQRITGFFGDLAPA